MRWVTYLLIAWLALPLQTVLLPPLLPGTIKPDLMLLLTIWVGMRENPWRGGIFVYALGWMYDAYAGTYPGLHGFVLLTIFLAVCGMSTRLNTESIPLLWCLIGGGTLLQGLLTLFALEFFANTDHFWVVMFKALPAQLLCNLIAAHLLRNFYLWLMGTPPGAILKMAGNFGRRHEH